jgi:hypothetical protein
MPGLDPDRKTEEIISDRLVMEKKTFEVGEAITVIATGTGKDWIGIQSVREYNITGGSAYWWYIVNIGSGTEFNLIGSTDGKGDKVNLPAGEYVIRLLENDVNFWDDAVAHMYFTVVESTGDTEDPQPTPDPEEPDDTFYGEQGKIVLNKEVFADGEAILCTISAATSETWIELHYENNGEYKGYGWQYVGHASVPADEEFDLRGVDYYGCDPYNFTPGRYKIIWYPTYERVDGVTIEFEIQ